MLQNFTFFKPLTKVKNTDTEVKDKTKTDNYAIRKYLAEKYRYEGANYYDDDEAERNKETASSKIKAFVKKNSLSCNLHLPNELPYYYFFVAMNTTQLSLSDVMHLMDLIFKYGAPMVMSVYFLVSVLFGIPLYLMFFFLANYSRQKCFRFWSSVPVLKGIIIPIVVLDVAYIIMNMSISGISLNLFWKSMVDSSDPNCTVESNFSNCIKYSPLVQSDCHVISALTFFYHHFGSGFRSFTINWRWLIIVIISYFCILILCLLSRLLLRWLVRCTLVFWCYFLLSSIIVILIFGSSSFLHNIWAGNLWDTFKIEFWLRVLLLSLRRISPDELVTYAAFTPERRLPTVEAYVGFLVRFAVVTTIVTLVLLSVNHIFKDYIIDRRCLRLNGFILFMAILPEGLGHATFGKIMVPCYFLGIYFYGFISAFYSINALLESIYNRFLKAYKSRKITITSFIIVCAILNSFVLNNNIYLTYMTFSNLVFAPCVTLFGSALFVIIYSTSRIMNDFQFIFGYRLSHLLTSTLRLFSVIAISSIFCYVFFVMWIERTHEFRIINFTSGMLCVAPVFVYALTNYINYKNGTTTRFMKPEMIWGPPSKAIRDARRKFNPKRVSRYLSLSKCVHDCLLESEALMSETERWKKRQEYFYQKYHVMHSEFRKHEIRYRDRQKV